MTTLNTCKVCGLPLTIQVMDESDGYVRNICLCEAKSKCQSCGTKNKVNQAQLTYSGELSGYFCAEHGAYEAISIPLPKPLDKRPGSDGIYSNMIGFELAAYRHNLYPEDWVHAWLTMTPEVKTAFDKTNEFVICSNNNCEFEHAYSSRVMETNEANGENAPMCPKCGSAFYKARNVDLGKGRAHHRGKPRD